MTVFAAIASYLRLHEPWFDAADAMEEASGFDIPSTTTGGSSPVGLFTDLLIGAPSTEPLLSRLRPSMDSITWRQNPTYTDEKFLSCYVYCELLGPGGLVRRQTASIGLLYLSPRTMYPSHAHPAEEAYHLLAGVSEWQAGAEALTRRSPGDRMEHPSGVPHSMRSGTTPMLALYVWRGDLATPARFLLSGSPAR